MSKTTCPECYSSEERDKKGSVYACESCGHEWDVKVAANGSEEPDVTSDDFRDVLLFNVFGETLDGCTAYEVDGHCEHGYPAWTMHLGYV